MRRMSIFSVGSLGLVVSLSACAEPETAPSAQQQQPILNGAVDSAAANDAVVLLHLAGGGGCTGTVFKIENDVSYILTAAHCTPARRAQVGSDMTDPVDLFDVASSTADVRYGDGESFDATQYDIAVLRVNANMNVTPIALAGASDGLSTGANVKSYGYGRTLGYQVEDDNTDRRVVDRPVAALDRVTIQYDQSDETGICAGDSGGPVVFGAGAERRVVGVHSNVANSSGQEECHGIANSVRVSSRLDFVNAVLDGTPLPQLSACQSCTRNSTARCERKWDTCRSDGDCRSLLQCLQSASTVAAQNECYEEEPLGVGPLNDYLECTCADACPTECAEDASCTDVPACGIRFTGSGGTRYTRCIEANCCDEADAASADGLGYVCLNDPTAEGCADNAKFQALEACSLEKCAAERPGGGSSSSSSGAEPAPEPEEEAPPAPTASSNESKDEGGCTMTAQSPASALWITFLVMLWRRTRRITAT